MAKCYQCQTETDLYIAGFPICLKCVDSQPTSGETQEMLRRRLEAKQQEALEQHRQALAQFEREAAEAAAKAAKQDADENESSWESHHRMKMSHEKYRRTHRMLMGHLKGAETPADQETKTKR